MNKQESYRIQQGRITKAEYSEQIIEEYAGNPFIEALPSIFTDEEIIRKFTVYPNYRDEDCLQDTNVRYHMIKRLLNFVQPLDFHFAIEKQLSSMIRRGYLSRNPVSIEFLKRLDYLYSIKNNNHFMLDKLNEIGETLRTTAESYSIIGLSGIGKTTAVERILHMYPQIIIHSDYKGTPLSRTQLVWVKIDCPYDGSIKTLCKSFFRSLDEALGTTYFKKFGYSGYTSSSMMLEMSALAARHGLGLLVIDELQHLLNKKNDAEEILNFLVTLVNTAGVPTVLVGTPKAQQVLEKDFRQARRAQGILWDRMDKDETWEFFLETMWKYQWLQEKTILNEKLSKVMYEESQGITSVAVNLYMFSQIRAMLNGTEKVTVGLVRDVAKKELSRIRKMIQAIKNKDIGQLARYDDIVIDLGEVYDNLQKDIKFIGKAEKLRNMQQRVIENDWTQFKEEVIASFVTLGMFSELKYNDYIVIIDNVINHYGHLSRDEIKIKIMEQAMQQNHMLQECEKDNKKGQKKKNSGLIIIFNRAKKRNKSVYEELKEEGVIKDYLEFY